MKQCADPEGNRGTSQDGSAGYIPATDCRRTARTGSPRPGWDPGPGSSRQGPEADGLPA